MLNFESDYTMGCHRAILERMLETNEETLVSYGDDKYSNSAKEKIASLTGVTPDCVKLLAGGTQTNQIVVSTVLKPYEAVVAAQTGHIAAHEAGAIEFTGHKVITLPHHTGKVDAGELEEYLKTYYADPNCEHIARPGMVYISHPTEYGTLYSKCELESLSRVCRENKLTLFMDGARLGYGLMSPHTDVTLRDIAELTDVFYIGGTKCGALLGEAVVFTKNNVPEHFLAQVKQHGALLAKGRVVGLQFDVLFEDGLYFSICKNAADNAEKLKKLLIQKGYPLFIDSPTNQQFAVVENNKLKELEKNVKVGFWEKYDEDHTVVRFATSWATDPKDIEALASLL